ncbi:MAG: hypothetical protein Q9167_008044, partial [Letrouitia subvulpina]
GGIKLAIAPATSRDSGPTDPQKTLALALSAMKGVLGVGTSRNQSEPPSTTSHDFSQYVSPYADARWARDERDERDELERRHQNTFDPRHRRPSYHVPSDAHKASIAPYDRASSPPAAGERGFLDRGNNLGSSRLPKPDGRSSSDRRVPHPLDTKSDVVMTSPAGSSSSASHPSTKVNGLKSGRSTPKIAMSKVVEPPEPANNPHMEALLSVLAASNIDLALRKIHHETAQRNFDQQMEERSKWAKHLNNPSYVAVDEALTGAVQKTEQARDRTAKLLSRSEESNVNAIKSLANFLSAAGNRTSSEKLAEESALQPMSGQRVDAKEDALTLKKLSEETKPVLEQTEKLQASYESQQRQIDLLKANTASEVRFKDFDQRLFALSDSQRESKALSVRLDQSESIIAGLQKSVNDSKALETALKQDLSNANAEIARLQNRYDIQQKKLEELVQDGISQKEQLNSFKPVEMKVESTIASITELKQTLDESNGKHESSIGSLHQASVNEQSHIDQLRRQCRDFVSSLSSIAREVRGPTNQLGDNGVVGFVQDLGNKATSRIEALSGSLEPLKSRLSALEEQLHSQSLANQMMPSSIPSSPRFWQRQDTPPISLSSRLKQSPDVPDSSTLQSINERFEGIFQEISSIKENENNRDEVVSAAIESVQNKSAKQQAVIDRLSTDVSILKDENGELKVKIESEKETGKMLESGYNAQATTVKAIQNNLLSLEAPRPDFLELQSKVDRDVTRLEANLKDFTSSVDDRVGPLEDFSTKMEARFDNLTTEYVVRNMIHQMQQMYPPHPGNYLQEIALLKEKQERQAHQTHQAFGIGQRAFEESRKALELKKIVSDIQQKVDMPPPNPTDSRAIKDLEGNLNRNSIAIEACRSQYQELNRQVDRLMSDQSPVGSLTARVESISKNLERLNPKEYQRELDNLSAQVSSIRKERDSSRDRTKVEVSKHRVETLGYRNETQASFDATQSKIGVPEKDFKELSQTVEWNHKNLVAEVSRLERENRALAERVSHLEQHATQDSISGIPSRNDEVDEDSDMPLKRLKRSRPSSQMMEERKISKKRRYEDDEEHSEGSDMAPRHTRQSARVRSHEVTNSPSTRSKGSLRAPSTDTTHLIDGRS